MSTIAPHFWRNPIRYCRWASHEKPALFYSVLIGAAGPIILVATPGWKKYTNYVERPKVPMTYPVPKGPRQQVDGYND